ncbi:acyl-CoA reductase [Balneola sp. MJW-20]|uniref:acyl-CoA reductase n=1 Tax=Gracilimonas aurantiaca TaxID=3234185 RepID=UPI0034BC3008
MTKHIAHVESAVKKWLQPDNFALKKAIDKTVSEGLFSTEDIRYQIRVLKRNVESGQIREWAERSGLKDERSAAGKKVLCLHAGNLPLVGFQTALGVILSGADYYGKLSRKDPYLMQSFLKLAEHELTGSEIQFSTDLNAFRELNADEVIFAGSEDSVEVIKKEIAGIKATRAEAGYHIRTAKYSMVYLDNKDPETMKDFAEAVLRYEGQGCRSVAIVVSPYRLDSFKCEMTDYIELFWMHNPPEGKVSPGVEYQFAFNKAIERSQAWLDHFLIQETDELPKYDRVVNWVPGDEAKVREMVSKAGKQLQSVYTTGNRIEGVETELVSKAQRPDLWWKPDGVDVIRTLINNER